MTDLRLQLQPVVSLPVVLAVTAVLVGLLWVRPRHVQLSFGRWTALIGLRLLVVILTLLAMLRPTLVFTVIISTIGGLQLFTEPVIFGNGKMLGGTLGQFQTVTMYMYETAFQRFQYGYGAAIAWSLFGLIVVFSLVNLLLIRRAAR